MDYFILISKDSCRYSPSSWRDSNVAEKCSKMFDAGGSFKKARVCLTSYYDMPQLILGTIFKL